MQRTKFAFPIVTAISMGLALTTASIAAAADLSTPEGAIAAYIEGVAEQDFDAVIAASAAENMSEKYDFVDSVERLKALLPSMPAPSSSPLFVDINRAQFAAEIGAQVKQLTYGLMTTNEVVNGKSVPMEAAAARDFESVVRADRLDSLELVQVGIPSPAFLNSERSQANLARSAKANGADASTERVALLSFEGLNFAVGFTLLKYGDEWFVRGQYAMLAGFDTTGSPKRMTPEEFANLLR